MTEQQAKEIIKLLRDIRFCIALTVGQMPDPNTDNLISIEKFIEICGADA